MSTSLPQKSLSAPYSYGDLSGSYRLADFSFGSHLNLVLIMWHMGIFVHAYLHTYKQTTTQRTYIYVYVYRVSQEKCARLRESVPYVKLYRYNPKHLYPNLNGYGDNDQRKVRSSCGSTYCTFSADALHVLCACQ